MGKDLERAMWRMYAPHKVKFAVSGCPRNCAESGIKDVGVIGVDSGWEMYIAGNGGIKTEVAHFLVKVKTAEEVLEYTGALCQPCGVGICEEENPGRPRRPQGAVGAIAVCTGW
jgi:nitrite reductase (NADH) large subunit